MSRKPTPPVAAKDLQGFKYFARVKPLLERLHHSGTASDKAGNRRYVGCDIEEKWVQVGIDRLARMSQETEEDEDWGDAAQTDDEDWGVGVTDKDEDWAA